MLSNNRHGAAMADGGGGFELQRHAKLVAWQFCRGGVWRRHTHGAVAVVAAPWRKFIILGPFFGLFVWAFFFWLFFGVFFGVLTALLPYFFLTRRAKRKRLRGSSYFSSASSNAGDFVQRRRLRPIFHGRQNKGDKNIIKFEGDHNSPRPQFYFDSISIFFNNVLQPPEDEGGSRYFDLSQDYFSGGRWSAVQDVELSDELLGSPSGPSAGSTEDAIRQLRSRRPMSAMVVPADISAKDNQPDSEVESRGSDAHPSTSNMISLEFSKDSPHDSLGPGSVDDDEYVEYSLDMLADFPNNVEEEERMLMVAIFESLKDSKGQNPPTEEPSSDVGGSSLPKPESAPAPKKETDGEILLPETPPKHPPSSEAEASKTCSSDTSTINHSKDETTTVKNQMIIVAGTRPTEGETSRPASHSDTPSGNHGPSDVDMADRTKVTVEVEKNPSTNIIDGLLRRWDIFRNR